MAKKHPKKKAESKGEVETPTTGVVANGKAGVDDGTALAVNTHGLTKSYGDFIALAPLDLQVPIGQRVSLIGANGSGKTTLLRLLAGLLDRTDGEIEINAFPVRSLDARAAVSYLPDDPVLYDDLSVREHLAYLGPLYGVTEWEARGDLLMERLGIAHRADDLPSRFSRGLRQKTSLAVGFLRSYSILLIDEPFVGLDEPGRRALLELLDEVAAEGKTVIVASHQLELVGRADRCIALADGVVVYDGDPGSADLGALVGG